MIINEENRKSKRKPNASDITHILAKLGGGSKKEGGDGMMGGMANIFQKGYELGSHNALEGKKNPGGFLGKSGKK